MIPAGLMRFYVATVSPPEKACGVACLSVPLTCVPAQGPPIFKTVNRLLMRFWPYRVDHPQRCLDLLVRHHSNSVGYRGREAMAAWSQALRLATIVEKLPHRHVQRAG